MGDNPAITYFNADLFKKVGDVAKKSIKEPGINIMVTIQIPNGLLNNDSTKIRTYKIIRIHVDEATGSSQVKVLNGTFDATTGEFTFATDKFSTYAIVYSDTSNPSSDYGSGSPVTPAVPVTDVKVSSAGQTLTKKGETMKLTVDFTPSNATDKKVEWSSSDPKVATVDENGTVTAVGNGTAIITAKTSNGKTATITITVKTEAESENPAEDKPAESGDNEVTVDNRFAAFRMASAKATKTTNTLTWKKIADADGYVVYGAPCNTRGKINKLKKLSVIKDGEATTYKAAGLKSGTYYKYLIKAYKLVEGKKVYLAESKTIHVTTTGKLRLL